MNKYNEDAQKELLSIANMEYRSPTIDVAIKFYKQNKGQGDFAVPPDEEVICIRCPRGLWMADLGNEQETSVIRCFCEVMHSYTWASDSPSRLYLCDGPVKAAREAQIQLDKINQ